MGCREAITSTIIPEKNYKQHNARHTKHHATKQYLKIEELQKTRFGDV